MNVRLLTLQVDEACVRYVASREGSNGIQLVSSNCSCASRLLNLANEVQDLQLHSNHGMLTDDLHAYMQATSHRRFTTAREGTSLMTSRIRPEGTLCAWLPDLMSVVAAPLSSLVRGSFGHEFVGRLSMPLMHDDAAMCTSWRLFESQQLSAEFLPFMWETLGLSSAQIEGVSKIVDRSTLHKSAWYSLSLQRRIRSLPQPSQSVTAQGVSLSATIRVALSSENSIVADDISRLQESFAMGEPKLGVQLQELPRGHFSASPMPFVQRYARDINGLDLIVNTHIHFDRSSTKQVCIQESLPHQLYHLQLHSFRYVLGLDALDLEWSNGRHVASLSSFTIDERPSSMSEPSTSSRADSSGSVGFCFQTPWSDADPWISSRTGNSTAAQRFAIHLQFRARKSFPQIARIPPDASYGVHIPPALIHVDDQLLITKSVLMTRPLPDSSMPYNVITIVSTLLAFLLGSLINVKNKSKKY